MIGAHDLDRFRTSYGDTSEPIEDALSRGEDDLTSFRTGIESSYKSEYAETEKLVGSELAQVLSKSIQNVVNVANESIAQEQDAMSERMRQLEVAADVRVHNDAAVAKLALTKAEQAMTQEHAREMTRVGDL